MEKYGSGTQKKCQVGLESALHSPLPHSSKEGNKVRKSKAHKIEASRMKEVILQLYSTLVRPRIWITVSSSRQELLERLHRWATKIIMGLEHFSYEERLKDVGMFSLEKTVREGSYQCLYIYKEWESIGWGQAFFSSDQGQNKWQWAQTVT